MLIFVSTNLDPFVYLDSRLLFCICGSLESIFMKFRSNFFFLISKISLKGEKDKFYVHKVYTAELSKLHRKGASINQVYTEEQERKPSAETHSSRVLRKKDLRSGIVLSDFHTFKDTSIPFAP